MSEPSPLRRRHVQSVLEHGLRLCCVHLFHQAAVDGNLQPCAAPRQNVRVGQSLTKMLVGTGHGARHVAAKGPTHIAGLHLRDELVVELGRNSAASRGPHKSANVVADGAGVVQNAALGVLRRHLPLVGEAVHLLEMLDQRFAIQGAREVLRVVYLEQRHAVRHKKPLECWETHVQHRDGQLRHVQLGDKIGCSSLAAVDALPGAGETALVPLLDALDGLGDSCARADCDRVGNGDVDVLVLPRRPDLPDKERDLGDNSSCRAVLPCGARNSVADPDCVPL